MARPAIFLAGMLIAGPVLAQKIPQAPEPDLASMARFEPATFRMGVEYMTPSAYGDAWFVAEQRARDVTLSAYHLDVDEVTVRDFALFLTYAAGEYHFHPDQPIERVPGGYLPIGGAEDLPITFVTWEAADHYCLWAGKRLPTEAEWEYAAAGGTYREYPWGDEGPDCSRAVFFTGSSFCEPEPASVGSRPSGATPEGVMDLAGNVSEWVADWYASYPAESETDPVGPATGDLRVVRGGGYLEEGLMLRSRSRRGADPALRSSNIGFRCAWSADPTDGAIRGVIDPPADEGREPTDRPLAPSVVLPEVLASGLVRPGPLAEVSGTVYVLDRGPAAIYELSGEGGAPLMVTDALDSPTDMATDGTDLFVTDAGTGDLLLVGTDGTVGPLASGLANPSRIAAEPGEVYFSTDDAIHRWTSSGVEILHAVSGTTGLALSDTHLYYASSGGSVAGDAEVGRIGRTTLVQETLWDSFGTAAYPAAVVWDPLSRTAYFLDRLRSWPVSSFIYSYAETATFASIVTYGPSHPDAAVMGDGRIVWATMATLVGIDPAADPTYAHVGTWTACGGILATGGRIVWSDRESGKVFQAEP